MKKTLSLLLLIILFVALLTGCGGGWLLELFGVSSINQMMKSGDWIYYSNAIDGSFYKIRTDLTEKTKLTDRIGIEFPEIQEDTIYFISYLGESYACPVCKIRTDGTGYTMIADLGRENIYGIQVSDEWIYYSCEKAIYRIKTVGTEKTKIADSNALIGIMLISGDWIYYMDGISLSKMRTDGTEVTTLSDNVELFTVKDDWIYCGEITEDGVRRNIYRIRLDGTEKSKLADGAFVAIDEGRIYYLKDDWLCRSNLDGSDVEKLNDVLDDVTVEVIYDDYIYYIENTETVHLGPAYRINLDGSNKIRIK